MHGPPAEPSKTDKQSGAVHSHTHRGRPQTDGPTDRQHYPQEHELSAAERNTRAALIRYRKWGVEKSKQRGAPCDVVQSPTSSCTHWNAGGLQWTKGLSKGQAGLSRSLSLFLSRSPCLCLSVFVVKGMLELDKPSVGYELYGGPDSPSKLTITLLRPRCDPHTRYKRHTLT